MKSLFTAAALTCSLLLSSAVSAESHPAKDPTYAWQMVKGGAQIIDVRTPEEFRSGHLEGALNIPYQQIIQGVHYYKIKSDKPLVVYCRSGRRSGIAYQTLIRAGYSHVYNGGAYELLKGSARD